MGIGEKGVRSGERRGERREGREERGERREGSEEWGLGSFECGEEVVSGERVVVTFIQLPCVLVP